MVFLPLVRNNLPPIIGSYHLYAAIWIVSLLVFEPKVFLQKLVLYFLVFGLFFTVIFPLLFWANISDWNLTSIRVEFYDMVIPISILGYYQYKKDFRSLAMFVKISVLFILITGGMTLYSASIDPMYARMMMSWYDEATMLYFNKLGGGNYGYVGALLGIFPILIYYWRKNEIIIYSKRSIVTIMLFLYFVVVSMQFFGNILISTLFIVLSFTSAKKIKRTAVIISLFFLIFISIPPKIYSNLFKSIATIFPTNSENFTKMTDMATYIETGQEAQVKNGIAETRAARAPELLSVFLYNPLFGSASNSTSNYDQAGAHLYWLNRLAVFGIMGLSMMILFQRFYFKHQIKYFDESYTVYFLLASFAILSYGLIKNIGGRETWYMYFVIIPGAYYLPLLNKKQKL
jgi:hypothetical protein